MNVFFLNNQLSARIVTHIVLIVGLFSERCQSDGKILCGLRLIQLPKAEWCVQNNIYVSAKHGYVETLHVCRLNLYISFTLILTLKSCWCCAHSLVRFRKKTRFGSNYPYTHTCFLLPQKVSWGLLSKYHPHEMQRSLVKNIQSSLAWKCGNSLELWSAACQPPRLLLH